IEGDAIILATGYSARDIFQLLHNKGILIEAKPFALGVRIEHPQSIIDAAQYHYHLNLKRDPFLSPASYSLVEQITVRGVSSFCMCPGGIIAPASTADRELLVNGWSPSKRNNPYANSGIVVQVEIADAITTIKNEGLKINNDNPLVLMYFKKLVEQKEFNIGGVK